MASVSVEVAPSAMLRAMSERMTELIDEIAEIHPEKTDTEIENEFDWEVREE